VGKLGVGGLVRKHPPQHTNKKHPRGGGQTYTHTPFFFTAGGKKGHHTPKKKPFRFFFRAPGGHVLYFLFFEKFFRFFSPAPNGNLSPFFKKKKNPGGKQPPLPTSRFQAMTGLSRGHRHPPRPHHRGRAGGFPDCGRCRDNRWGGPPACCGGGGGGGGKKKKTRGGKGGGGGAMGEGFFCNWWGLGGGGGVGGRGPVQGKRGGDKKKKKKEKVLSEKKKKLQSKGETTKTFRLLRGEGMNRGGDELFGFQTPTGGVEVWFSFLGGETNTRLGGGMRPVRRAPDLPWRSKRL